MKMLKVYGIDKSDEWDKAVRSFREYDVYWLSGYVKSFMIHGDGEPLLFYYNDGRVRGIHVVMKRDISDDKHFLCGRIEKEKYFDFATPYGYGGWIIESEVNVDPLFETYEHWVKKNDVISEFVRFHPLIRNHAFVDGAYEITQLGETVHMELSSPEAIWNNLTCKNRNVIRKALKNDIKIYNGRFPEIYEAFRNIYNRTMDRDEAEDYYYFDNAFYKSVLEDLPYNAQIFWAEKDEKIIAISILIGADGRLNYHLSGSLKEFGSFAPTNLLLYKAAVWGHENGYRTLNLGGGVGSMEDSLFKFKKSFFKGKLNRFYIGKRIYNSKKYNELVRLRGGEEALKSSFFPLYRSDSVEKESGDVI